MIEKSKSYYLVKRVVTFPDGASAVLDGRHIFPVAFMPVFATRGEVIDAGYDAADIELITLTPPLPEHEVTP